MTTRSVTHATFTVERRYAASPAEVFAAWADAAAKRRWFADAEGWTTTGYELDFRVGGSESFRGTPDDGPAIGYEGVFQDIVAEQRIVYSYAMSRDDRRISVSVATVQLQPDGEGTRLTYTEQGAFLDGYDRVDDRESGMGGLLDALGAELG
jgi:uncharacterized protein YndB with AHSA1/START domain